MKTIVFFTLGLLALVYVFGYPLKTSSNREKMISGIMGYCLEPIVQRCKKDHAYTDEDMVILEKELKRYFVLSACNESALGMYSKDVDNLWHTFILYTKAYADFCDKHMHCFLHHSPETDSIQTPEKLQKTRKAFQAFIKSYEELFQEKIHPIWLLDMCEMEESTGPMII